MPLPLQTQQYSTPWGISLNSRLLKSLDTDSKWIAEVKKNGWRAIVIKDEGKATIWTRHGTTINEPLKEIRESLTGLPDGTMLDGEILFTRRVKGVPDSLYLFDIMFCKGERLADRMLSQRKGILEIVYKEYLATCPKITLAKMVNLGKIALYNECIKDEVNEGIVLKSLASKYLLSDNSCLQNPFWLKILKPNKAMCTKGGISSNKSM